MATIEDAIQEMVDIVNAVTGMRNVPGAPPDTNDQFPFATLIPVSGRFEMQSRAIQSWHDVEIHLHVERKGMTMAYNQIMPLLTTIPKALMQELSDGGFTHLTTWEGDISYVWETSSWQNTPTLAFIFTVEGVKVLDTLT